jgi:hypothetical protein
MKNMDEVVMKAKPHELTYHEKQFVKYTKGWFEEKDMIEDIKKIMGAEYGCSPQHYSTSDVLGYVEVVYFKLVEYGLITYRTNRVFSELFYRVDIMTWGRKKEIEMKDVIEFLYSQISNIPVKGKFDLGEPDYTILPKKENKDE